MTSLHQALFSFWSQFSHEGKAIPAYYAGMVPDGADFPYITFTVSSGDAFTKDISTAFVWFRRVDGKNPIPLCAAVMDSVAKAIPAEGVLIRLDDGLAALYRNEADWLTYMQDAEDPDVWGGRISYEINYYL